MPDYRVQLTINSSDLEKFKGRDSVRVQIVASDSENMPVEIFGFRRTPVDISTGETQDEFCFVSSPYDLTNFPVDEPDEEQDPPFFRKDTIDVLLPSVSKANEFIVEVKAQVQYLTELMTKLDALASEEIVWIPDAP